MFAAFDYTSLSAVKAVILGQDPYFNANQAEGLCFSVKKGTAIPPSLNRIYKVHAMNRHLPVWKFRLLRLCLRLRCLKAKSLAGKLRTTVAW